MNFNVFSLFSLIAGLLCVVLSFLVVIIKRKSYSALAFAKVCLFVGIWTLFPFSASLAKTNEEALAFTRLVYLAASFVPYLFFKFMFITMEVNEKENIKRFTKFSLVCAGLFFLFCHSPFFIKDVVRGKFYFMVIPGPLYFIFMIYFTTSYCYATPKLLNLYSISKGYRKNQLKYIILAFFLAFAAGSIHFLSAYGIPEVFPHDILVILFSLIFTYAIVRHRLMDITIAVTKVSLFIVVYTLALGVPFVAALLLRPSLSAILGINWWMVPLGLMALLATTGPFIYIYLNKRAEERLFKEQRRYQDILKRASLGMTRVRDIGRLLKLIVYTVAKSVRLNHAAIYILNKEADGYVLGSHRGNPRSAQPQAIDLRSPLIRHFLNSKKPLLLEELDPHPVGPENAPRPEVCLPDRQVSPGQGESQNNFIKAQLYTLSASVVIPSFIEDDLVGFMVLGEKRSGSIYTEDDLRVFTVLANQAGLAIENARFFEIAQETQEQIAQAEKMATLGTMANGLSHQMNNRFHAMSLIASDALDSIKRFNSKNSSPETKELLSYLEYSAERIKSNSLQGGNIVRGMLKYSRKGEPGFAGVNLNELLNATLEMLQFKIKLSEIDIERNYPQDEINLKANFTQLQEVFFNLIDNAYDAMNERKAALKEPGYRGKVNISTIIDPQNHTTRIIVQDNGLGIKEEDQKKIFTPFFTTKISNRKGTGLGLYVIKKIISENHKGRIQVSSVYQQGTTFSLDLTTADHKNSTLIKGNVEIWGE